LTFSVKKRKYVEKEGIITSLSNISGKQDSFCILPIDICHLGLSIATKNQYRHPCKNKHNGVGFMKWKQRWWTLQLVPHGKGEVKSFKVIFLPIVIFVLFFVCLLITTGASTYYLWDVNRELGDHIHDLNQVQIENHNLKVHIGDLKNELTNLNNDVRDLQEWLTEVELLEQELRELEPSGKLDNELLELTKSSSIRISGYGLDSQSTSHDISQFIEQTKIKIESIRVNAGLQQVQLTQLKEQIEEEQYLAQFIPSIPPAKGRVTSPFGWRRDPLNGRNRLHEGIDFADSYGAPIYAAANGTIIAAKRNSHFGKQIIIDHGNGYRTTYSHLTGYNVKKGDIVEKGETIGKMGSTGRSTGVHLHYEIHKNGQPINPLGYIRGGKSIAGKKTAN
jgi:murein DD-endopeptidase MepM/ murein hydrolase activator NlpD